MFLEYSIPRTRPGESEAGKKAGKIERNDKSSCINTYKIGK